MHPYDDFLFIGVDSDMWPHGHYCPVVRDREAAAADDKDGVELTRGVVFRNDITTVVGICHRNGWSVEEWRAAHRVAYRSIQHMISQGWRVD